MHEDLYEVMKEVSDKENVRDSYNLNLNETFITTIKKKKEHCFHKLLPHITNINFCEGKMMESPLHHAAREGLKNIVNKIIAVNGVDINLQNINKVTPLHLAAFEGHHDIVEILLTAGADFMIPNKKSKIALHLAAEKGKDKCCEVLVKNSLNPQKQLKKLNSEGDTALIAAAKNGNKNCCEFLILDNIDVQNKMGNTALHCAAQKGFTTTVKYLLDTNSNYKIRNDLGNTAAHEAAAKNYKLTLTELIEHDPQFYLDDCDTNNKKMSLLHASFKSLECLSYILEFNSEILNNCDFNNETALHLAIKAKNVECAEKILEYDTDLKIVNNESKTVLHLAAEKNLPTICSKILSKDRLIIDSADNMNLTALHVAAGLNSIDCCRIILKKRPRIDAIDGNGRNPLHIAAANGNSLICKYLIQAKVQLNTKDDFGNTVLHQSAFGGHLECTKLLLKSGRFLARERNKKKQLALDVAFEKKNDEVFEYILSLIPYSSDNGFNTEVHDFMHTALNEKRRLVSLRFVSNILNSFINKFEYINSVVRIV